MKARFPDFEKLKEKIADAKKSDPQTMMPPFGRNHILTPEQIDSVAKYIYQY
jgi:sulfur-oxidizing protein SoxX